MIRRIELADLRATELLAARMAQALQPPLVIGLVGDLGAGKTALVRALVQSLAPGTRVKSPTYTLLESYELPNLQIHHLDLYRLRHPEELSELGLAELMLDEAVLLIEWPGQGGAQTPDLDLQLTLHRRDETTRSAEFEAFTEAAHELLKRLALT